MNGLFNVPSAINEPVYEYAPQSNERALLSIALKEGLRMI